MYCLTLVFLCGEDLWEGYPEGFAVIDVEFCLGHDMTNNLSGLVIILSLVYYLSSREEERKRLPWKCLSWY